MANIKSRRNRNTESAEVDMTPMLDIVFIMLIFFIVSAVFLDETGIKLAEKPDVPPPPKTETVKSISIYVDAADRISVNSELTELTRVPLAVESLMATAPDANVILIADAKASLEPVVHIKDQMDAAGRRVVLEVRK